MILWCRRCGGRVPQIGCHCPLGVLLGYSCGLEFGEGQGVGLISSATPSREPVMS